MNEFQKFQTTLTRVISHPECQLPENFLDLNIKEGLKEFLEPLPHKIQVKFALGEAELVLPIYEAKFPEDNNPRLALEAVREWLINPTEENRVKCRKAAEAIYNAAVAAAGAVAGAVAGAAWAAGPALARSRPGAAYLAADYVQRADPRITLESQIKRLLRIIMMVSGSNID